MDASETTFHSHHLCSIRTTSISGSYITDYNTYRLSVCARLLL